MGRDTISDFTTNLIKEFLLEYTQTFALGFISAKRRRRFAVQKVRFDFETFSWEPGVTSSLGMEVTTFF